MSEARTVYVVSNYAPNGALVTSAKRARFRASAIFVSKAKAESFAARYGWLFSERVEEVPPKQDLKYVVNQGPYHFFGCLWLGDDRYVNEVGVYGCLPDGSNDVFDFLGRRLVELVPEGEHEPVLRHFVLMLDERRDLLERARRVEMSLKEMPA